MKFDVKPLEQVNQIHFGMSRKEIRKLYKNRYNVFKKNIFSRNTTDDFRDFHVYYDKNNTCEAVEICNFDDMTINGKPVSKDFNDFKKVIDDLAEDMGSYISKTYSVGITVEDGLVESVLFGCKGYYE